MRARSNATFHQPANLIIISIIIGIVIIVILIILIIILLIISLSRDGQHLTCPAAADKLITQTSQDKPTGAHCIIILHLHCYTAMQVYDSYHSLLQHENHTAPLPGIVLHICAVVVFVVKYICSAPLRQQGLLEDGGSNKGAIIFSNQRTNTTTYQHDFNKDYSESSSFF